MVFQRRKEEAGGMGPSRIWTGKRFPWFAVVVALGLGLRLYHYLRNPSMWHDEAALVLNVLNKDFLALLGPLTFSEAAPPAFLWMERAITLLLGDSTYALRLIPFLASCGALLLMVPVAQRVLRPPAVPWALLLMACSDHILWHTCEAKPYAVDIFAATAVLAIFCSTASWPLAWQLAVYTLLAPLLIFSTYPGCFLGGGVLVALLPAVWRKRQVKTWIGYGVLVLTVVTAFGLLLAGPIRAQRCTVIVDCWKSTFPRWDRPATVPAWTVLGLFEVFRYCFEPVGQAFLFLAVVGGVRLWRRRSRTLLALLLIPALLPLLAAYFQAYPFGGSRVVVYTAPALALLIAEGLPVDRDALRPLALRDLCRYGVFAVALLPLAWAVYRTVEPWNRADCAGAAEYVLAHRRPGEAVAANHWEYAYYFRHLGTDFTLLEEADLRTTGPLWLVATAVLPEDRLAIWHLFERQGWHMLEQQDFTRTTVFRLWRSTR
jgi:hypothetical protein